MPLPRKRLDIPCAPDHECSDEEISSILTEILDIDSDSTIQTYRFPTLEEMRTIVDTANSYKGDWYHSKVTLKAVEFLPEEEKNSAEFMKLHRELLTDEMREKGVSVSSWYDIEITGLTI